MSREISLANLDKDLCKLEEITQKKLDGITSENFANPLDFIHDKFKSVGYLERVDESKILLGKSKVVEEFSLLLKKEIDKQTDGYTSMRMDILNKEEDEEDNTPPEELMEQRGLLNGRILANIHLKVLITTTDNMLAKELAIKLGLNIPTG